MQPVQVGDRIQVHYVKRFEDGSVTTSRKRTPLELTVGVELPQLPGLGLALVGLLPGAITTVHVDAEHAYGSVHPDRIRSWSRARFPEGQALPVGQWVPVQDRQGRRRLVRIKEILDDSVIVDTNHRRAGLSVDLEVEVISIRARSQTEGQREDA